MLWCLLWKLFMLYCGYSLVVLWRLIQLLDQKVQAGFFSWYHPVTFCPTLHRDVTCQKCIVCLFFVVRTIHTSCHVLCDVYQLIGHTLWLRWRQIPGVSWMLCLCSGICSYVYLKLSAKQIYIWTEPWFVIYEIL